MCGHGSFSAWFDREEFNSNIALLAGRGGGILIVFMSGFLPPPCPPLQRGGNRHYLEAHQTPDRLYLSDPVAGLSDSGN